MELNLAENKIGDIGASSIGEILKMYDNKKIEANGAILLMDSREIKQEFLMAVFDLKKNILTLPLIYLFENLSASEVKVVKRQLNNHVKKSEIRVISKLIEKHGGIQFAENQIDRLSKEAQDELNIFPDSDYKDSLLAALKFNSHRYN